MLSETQVDLIRDSAQIVARSNVAATDAFYASLFKTAPGVRPLFAEDMFAQSEKLWQSIVMVVESADNLGEILDALKELGARHVGYGAEPAHYDVVADVLLQTLGQVVGVAWTDDHHAAWKAALDAVCATMLEGAAQGAA